MKNQIDIKDQEISALKGKINQLKDAYKTVNDAYLEEQRRLANADYSDEEWSILIESLGRFFTQGIYTDLHSGEFASDAVDSFNVSKLITYSNRCFVGKFVSVSR